MKLCRKWRKCWQCYTWWLEEERNIIEKFCSAGASNEFPKERKRMWIRKRRVKFNLCSSHNKERRLVKLDVFYKKMHWFFAGSLMTESLTSQLVLAVKVTGKMLWIGEAQQLWRKIISRFWIIFWNLENSLSQIKNKVLLYEQLCNYDKSGLNSWMLLLKTVASCEEKSTPVYKGPKEWVRIATCCNSSSNHKRKQFYWKIKKTSCLTAPTALPLYNSQKVHGWTRVLLEISFLLN
jgi:hypothetical protein